MQQNIGNVLTEHIGFEKCEIDTITDRGKWKEKEEEQSQIKSCQTINQILPHASEIQ